MTHVSLVLELLKYYHDNSGEGNGDGPPPKLLQDMSDDQVRAVMTFHISKGAPLPQGGVEEFVRQWRKAAEWEKNRWPHSVVGHAPAAAGSSTLDVLCSSSR